MTVFPSVTEIFVYGDLVALREAGHEIGILHFIEGSQEIWQEDAAALRAEVIRGGPLVSPAALGALLATLIRRPLRSISTLAWIALRSGPSLRGRLKTLGVLPKCALFAADCRRWGADQVHATWANHAAVAGLVIERLSGIPFSVSAHAGQDVFREPVMLREKVRAARFVAVCNGAAHQRLLEIAGPGCGAKLHHVPHGVRLDRFPFVARDGAAALGGPRRILFVGRFHRAKGTAHLIEATRILRDGGIDVRVELLGDGPEAAALREQIARLELESVVRMHGAVSQQVVKQELARADVLALPSEIRPDGARDGLPNVILEAMASGTPVVASRVSAVEEAVENDVTGLLVPQRDPAALAAALRRVLEDRSCAERLTVAAREQVQQRFDRAVCTARFVQLFERSGMG